jgi:hypothetical protein
VSGMQVYVAHDATTGWSKYGYSSCAHARIEHLRRSYNELRNAEMVGILDNLSYFDAQRAEFVAGDVVEDALGGDEASISGRIIGERFTGVDPQYVLFELTCLAISGLLKESPSAICYSTVDFKMVEVQYLMLLSEPCKNPQIKYYRLLKKHATDGRITRKKARRVIQTALENDGISSWVAEDKVCNFISYGLSKKYFAKDIRLEVRKNVNARQ